MTNRARAAQFVQSGVPLLEMHLLSDHGGSGGPILNLAGDVVGLVQRGGDQHIESLDLASFTDGDPTNLCEGVARGVASTVCRTAPAGGGASSSRVYTGRSFSLRYPPGWSIRNAETNKGSYTDTTILDPANPSWLLRIDTSFGYKGSPDDGARELIAKLRRVHGYHEISQQHVNFVGYRALRWEFEIPENGVLVRKVDIFFKDGPGNGWGILYQAPASQWTTAAPRLQATVAGIQLLT